MNACILFLLMSLIVIHGGVGSEEVEISDFEIKELLANFEQFSDDELRNLVENESTNDYENNSLYPMKRTLWGKYSESHESYVKRIWKKFKNKFKCKKSRSSELENQLQQNIIHIENLYYDLYLCNRNLNIKSSLLIACNIDLDRITDEYEQCNATLESTVDGYEQCNATLDSTIDGYEQCNATLESTVAGYEQCNATLDRTIDGYEQCNATLGSTIDGYEQCNTTLDEVNDLLENCNEVLNYCQGRVDELEDIIYPCETIITAAGDDLVNLGEYYFAFFERSVTWYQAKAACEALGMTLAYGIDNSAKRNLLINHLGLTPTSNEYYWLGGSSFVTEGVFTWGDADSSGSINIVDSSAWASPAPDNYYGDEDCVELFSEGQLGLNDYLCDSAVSTGYICEASPKCRYYLQFRNA